MADFGSANIDEPIDLIKLCIGKDVRVKMRHGRELSGVLHAFDKHFNLLVSNAEESHTFEEENPETKQLQKKTKKRKIPMLYARGDQILLIAPQSKQ